MNPTDAIEAGRQILEPGLAKYGFRFVSGPVGVGSGGSFASGAFVRGDWRLEFHFRQSLGMVSYHCGDVTLDHELYMETVLGGRGLSTYPGFSSDPLVPFHDLAADLDHHCRVFLNGTSAEFRAIAEAASRLPRRGGLARTEARQDV